MPVINGEKWACSSCIKGHRVSGCTHHDRELHHINPKGRPVKQCEHCRGARKSKSHHAKCDCGDKKDKDKAKENGDSKVDDAHCGCHTGSKCTCGVKREPLDLKLDTTSLKVSHHGLKTKPRLTSTQSESTLTVFANGHHKPCHRLNNAAHVSGAPYKIPRPHTLHGPSAFANYSHDSLEKLYGQHETTGLPAQPARSMDTLSLTNHQFYNLFGSSSASIQASAGRSADSLPLTPLNETAEGNNAQNGSYDSLFNGQLNLNTFGRDGTSPVDNQSLWATSIPSSTHAQFGLDSLSTSPSQEYNSSLDNDWALPSATFSNHPLWSAGDLPLDPSKLTDGAAQPISHSGESKHSAPGMTTSSSAQSEVGEPAFFGDVDFSKPLPVSWEDTPAFRPATTSFGNDARQAPTSMPVDTSRSSHSFDFLKFASPFNEGSLFEENPLSLTFPTSNVEETQPSKTASTTVTSGQLDAQSAFTTVDYTEPRSITIPNNIDDIATNNPWLPLLDASSNNDFDASTSGLDASFQMAGYQNWL